MRHVLRVAVVLSGVVLVGCGERVARDAASTATATPAAIAASDSGVTLEPIDTATLRALASDGRARVTLVNVWATWCAPCREEFPELLAAARAHAGDGVRLVLVSTDFPEQLPEARRFLAAHGVRDSSYVKHDSDQAFIDGLDPRWTGTIPATFVYDAAGRRVAFWEGRADRARFEAAIRRALGAAATTDEEKAS
jgi:thiol-disulfide isomerase/thioredoxin